MRKTIHTSCETRNRLRCNLYKNFEYYLNSQYQFGHDQEGALNRMKGDSQKVQWLSPKKLAFIWEEKINEHFPWGYAEIGKKQIIVIAEEEGKDLFFVESGENGGYHKDSLCWFCQNSIDLKKSGHAPTCLLGKYI